MLDMKALTAKRARPSFPGHSRSACLLPSSCRPRSKNSLLGLPRQDPRPSWQLFASSPSEDPQPADPAPPQPDEVLETVQYAFDAAGNAAEDALTTSQTAAQDALQTSQAAFQEAAAVTQDAAEGALDVAQEAAAAVGDAVTQEAGRLANQAADAAGLSSSTSASSSSTSSSVMAAAKVQGAAYPDPRFAGMKVLVAGATGGVGKFVVEELAKAGVPQRALVRDISRANQLLGGSTSTLDIVRGDVYQYAGLPAAMEGCTAVVCCTGARDPKDPFGPFHVDYQGTLNLIAAAKAKGVKKFVLVTSIGTDDVMNPLNLFWGVLFWKKRAEEALQRSGLSYTIVRPGGLKNSLRAWESLGNVVMKGPNYYGFPPLKESGSILRSQVAEVCIESLVNPAAEGKVLEIIADDRAPALPYDALFSNAQQY